MTHAALSARMDGLRSSAIRDLLTLTARPDVISLAGGLPDPDFIPRERISKAAHDALGDPSSVQYGETSGLLRLREVIAERESSKIGRTLDVSEVVITHGSQQGLSLLAQVLLDAGDVVVVEEPAYTGALQVFRTAQARLVPVQLDEDGMDTDALEAKLDAGLRPKVVHTVSNFHNPRARCFRRSGERTWRHWRTDTGSGFSRTTRTANCTSARNRPHRWRRCRTG